MTDRLQEIRARLDAATPGPWEASSASVVIAGGSVMAGVPLPNNADFIAHAPADIAWLLDEIQMLHTDIDEVIRKGEDAADYWKQQFDSLRRQHKEMRP